MKCGGVDADTERAQPSNRCAAFVQTVRSEIEVKPVPTLRPRSSADVVAVIEQHHAGAQTAELNGGCEPAQPPAHHNDVFRPPEHASFVQTFERAMPLQGGNQSFWWRTFCDLLRSVTLIPSFLSLDASVPALIPSSSAAPPFP